MFAEIRRRFGLWRCSRGSHAPLTWLRASERPVPINSQPREMLAASGFLAAFAKWNGWCPRCGDAVEWADHDPRKPLRTRPPKSRAEYDRRVQRELRQINGRRTLIQHVAGDQK